ncbi:MAG: hypothetical protein HYY59_06275 [Candidatus Omnitrophica bacterium]|nr:hypothetical protein [Candidatus Omnitrophota bacterium]
MTHQLYIGCILAPRCKRFVAKELLSADEEGLLRAVPSTDSMLPHLLKGAAYNRSEQIDADRLIAEWNATAYAPTMQ